MHLVFVNSDSVPWVLAVSVKLQADPSEGIVRRNTTFYVHHTGTANK